MLLIAAERSVVCIEGVHLVTSIGLATYGATALSGFCAVSGHYYIISRHFRSMYESEDSFKLNNACGKLIDTTHKFWILCEQPSKCWDPSILEMNSYF
jgi:hypothetical protein